MYTKRYLSKTRKEDEKMDKIFNKILNENEMVNNLTAATEQVEMFKNLKEQIKKARNLRIK